MTDLTDAEQGTGSVPSVRWNHDVPLDDRLEVDDRPEVIGDDDDEHDVVLDACVVETRAMDLVEIAVEVTAPPDAEPDDVVPARADRSPRFADEHDDDPAEGPAGDPALDPAVDPRIAERRGSVAADRRRRRVRVALGLLALALTGAAVVGVAQSRLLDVDEIDIVGTDQLAPDQLRRLAGLGVGDPILFVDPDRVEERLRRDPRFVRVAVSRQLPSTVSIRVTDRRAIAVVVGPQRSLVVGEDGIVISEATGDELLRHVEVQDDPRTAVGRRLPAPLAAAVDVMGSMSYEIAVQIQRMSITPEGELVFDLGEDRVVLFGTVEDSERKLLAIRTMLGPQVDLRGMCRLDVRVPTAPTLRRDPDCDPPPPPTTAAPVADPAAAAADAGPVDATEPSTPVETPLPGA